MHLGQDQLDEMRAHPNVSSTGHLMGLLPWHVGMEMVLTASLLPPKYVRGTACKAVGIELHPQEPCIKGRESIATQGCVVLRYMPKCIYVQIEGSTQVFLQPSSPGAFSAWCYGFAWGTGYHACNSELALHAIFKHRVHSSCSDADAAFAKEAVHVARGPRKSGRSWVHSPLGIPIKDQQGSQMVGLLCHSFTPTQLQHTAQPWVAK